MKRRVTIEVDDAALFEAMKLDPDFAYSFGYHMTATLLTGQPPEFLDEFALERYGISVVGIAESEEDGEPA